MQNATMQPATQRKQAEAYIKKLKLKGPMPIEQAMKMNTRDKMKLASSIAYKTELLDTTNISRNEFPTK